MPPSRHSSSSHSSSSRSSSSRSSSSHSSSSRSSSSYSSRSYSSRSSFGSSGRSSFSSGGPSRHSSSSWSSSPKSSGSFSGKTQNRQSAPAQVHRPRVNQPIGYLLSTLPAPRTYYGSSHDYVYYPSSWTDSSTGTTYAQGYYDENGKYYESVAFAKDGKYENVVCHCDYCGQDVVLNPDSTKEALTNLKCPNCTAPLIIKSMLDEEVGTSRFDRADSFEVQKPAKKKKRKWPWIVAIILIVLYYIGSEEQKKESYQFGNTQQTQFVENDTSDFGATIRLRKAGPNRFSYAESGSADKTLIWDKDAESYYDQESDCWLWYNTDVDPSVWQYWYEGISSDYGDYGWMEHASDGWYIEISRENWKPLPGRYDISNLWYIE